MPARKVLAQLGQAVAAYCTVREPIKYDGHIPADEASRNFVDIGALSMQVQQHGGGSVKTAFVGAICADTWPGTLAATAIRQGLRMSRQLTRRAWVVITEKIVP